jgi:hypothetical protein
MSRLSTRRDQKARLSVGSRNICSVLAVRIFLWPQAGVIRQASVDLMDARLKPLHAVEQVCQLALDLLSPPVLIGH